MEATEATKFDPITRTDKTQSQWISGLHAERVVGSGGRSRTVWTGCTERCWHGGYAQAVKCIKRRV